MGQNEDFGFYIGLERDIIALRTFLVVKRENCELFLLYLNP